MFSVAVKGYGVVIWRGDGEWRTYGASASLNATLAARVDWALQAVPRPASEDHVRAALLAMTGAGLIAADSGTAADHEGGETSG